jgi:hypothetical protein
MNLKLVLVEDRLPDPNKLVFAIKGGFIGLAYHNGIEWRDAITNDIIGEQVGFFRGYFQSLQASFAVTHWIDLEDD